MTPANAPEPADTFAATQNGGRALDAAERKRLRDYEPSEATINSLRNFNLYGKTAGNARPYVKYLDEARCLLCDKDDPPKIAGGLRHQCLGHLHDDHSALWPNLHKVNRVYKGSGWINSKTGGKLNYTDRSAVNVFGQEVIDILKSPEGSTVRAFYMLRYDYATCSCLECGFIFTGKRPSASFTSHFKTVHKKILLHIHQLVLACTGFSPLGHYYSDLGLSSLCSGTDKELITELRTLFVPPQEPTDRLLAKTDVYLCANKDIGELGVPVKDLDTGGKLCNVIYCGEGLIEIRARGHRGRKLITGSVNGYYFIPEIDLDTPLHKYETLAIEQLVTLFMKMTTLASNSAKGDGVEKVVTKLSEGRLTNMVNDGMPYIPKSAYEFGRASMITWTLFHRICQRIHRNEQEPILSPISEKTPGGDPDSDSDNEMDDFDASDDLDLTPELELALDRMDPKARRQLLLDQLAKLN